MKSTNCCNGTREEKKSPDESRRTFLKQSSFITAIALAPSTVIKAAENRLD
ncbi:MAG: hypothetical protein WKF89_16020 [Chitinophagaceae bacterium]